MLTEEDVLGKIFGKLKVIEISKLHKIKKKWKCRCICVCGSECEVGFYYILNSTNASCNRCRKNIRYTIEEAKEIFLKENCTLLAEEYVNGHELMEFICVCGKKHQIGLTSFLRGYRCGCQRYSKEKHASWNPDRDYIERYRKFVQRCVNQVYYLLKQDKKNPNIPHKTLKYSQSQLRNHLKWDDLKYKEDLWIDHIYPISIFFSMNILDLKIINSIDNLQLISWRDNIIKTNNYDKELFKEWLLNKGIVI